jgi:hypothetical protein
MFYPPFLVAALPLCPLSLFTLYLVRPPAQVRSRGSAIGIVFGYELDDRATQVRFPAEATDFYSNF